MGLQRKKGINSNKRWVISRAMEIIRILNRSNRLKKLLRLKIKTINISNNNKDLMVTVKI